MFHNPKDYVSMLEDDSSEKSEIETTTSTTSGSVSRFELEGSHLTSTFMCEEECSHGIAEGIPLLNITRGSAQRRVHLSRKNYDDSFGFAIQSYVFKRNSTSTFERIVYVDYVQVDSIAERAGVQKGDVVIAVNGSSVVSLTHPELVGVIASLLEATLVLNFKDVTRIISLTMRSLQLRYILEEKCKLLLELEEREKALNIEGNDETTCSAV